MDDYNVNVLSEAKNEYSSRLVTILTPLIIEGVRSIFNEACKLCEDNDEEEKYLMTFQNFLSRVPKWNTTIIEEEKKRILQSSGCSYLEDLIICVHITQLKILTSIRVSQKQKKIDIDIPKLEVFIHKCYIHLARKLYQNVYLFEKDLIPLDFQKNNREIELLCQESILQVTRDSMPIEKILRAYIDKTVDEEVLEETIEKTVEENVAKQMEDELYKAEENGKIASDDTNKITKNDVEMNTVEKPELNKNKAEEPEKSEKQYVTSNNNEQQAQNINLIIETPKTELSDKEDVKNTVKETVDTLVNSISATGTNSTIGNVSETSRINKETKLESSSRLSFNDKDSVLDMGTNKSKEISAPKTIKRLEKISKDQNEKRKIEEAEEDDEDDDETLQIMDNTSIKLDTLDIHSLDKEVKLEPNIILDNIEVLT